MDNQLNPYETPKSNPMDLAEPLAPVPVGKLVRLVNYFIDYIMQIILVMVYFYLASVIGGDEVIAKLDGIPAFILGLMALFPYYLLMEASIGRTVGKLVTGTKVVNEDGYDASFAQIVGRTFARIIPFEAVTFLGSETRGWHDSMPNTYVVKCR